jgi:hypothetical protein
VAGRILAVELEFNPQVGEQVIGPPFGERYEVVERRADLTGEPLLTLRRLRDGIQFKDQPLIWLQYSPEDMVERALHKLLLAAGTEVPTDFQEKRFKVTMDAMYDGTPRVMVYFYLKADVIPSPERARVWNDFYRKLHAEIDPLMDQLPIYVRDDEQTRVWLQFMTREERSPLSVAS